MRRIDRIRTGNTEERLSLTTLAEQIDAQFKYGGFTYPTGVTTTWGSTPGETVGNSYDDYATGGYKGTGIVFAAVSTRQRILSEIEFKFRRRFASSNGAAGSMYGTTALQTLERPWPNAVTGDLVARMELHNSLTGNAYVYRDRKRSRFIPLRPDWVSIVSGSMEGEPKSGGGYDLEDELLGYVYQPGGIGSSRKATWLPVADVAHWAPVPDPDAAYRGMSWMTPILTDIAGDKAATTHKLKFFENAATPNLALRYPKEVTPDQLKQYLALIDEEHKGAQNAYKTLHIGGGADPVVVGSTMQQLDFKVTQGAGETRIAAASGVPSIIHGFAEGLDAATYSNFGQARRLGGDAFFRPMWRSLAGALATIVDVPGDSELWYDPSRVSFLQEDEMDAAAIVKEKALTIESLIRAGYEPASVAAAVQAGDLSGLVHTGLYSVQLQPAGADQPAAAPPA